MVRRQVGVISLSVTNEGSKGFFGVVWPGGNHEPQRDILMVVRKFALMSEVYNLRDLLDEPHSFLFGWKVNGAQP